jgi:hypothetical protein
MTKGSRYRIDQMFSEGLAQKVILQLIKKRDGVSEWFARIYPYTSSLFAAMMKSFLCKPPIL